MNDKKSVLLVDSDREFCRAIKAMFQEHGHMVSTVHDGLMALDILAKLKVDLIISELAIPNLDGIELMREINKRKINVPVIFLTANGEVESYMGLMNMGAFDYLHKSANEREMLRVFKNAFQKSWDSRIPVGQHCQMVQSQNVL